VKQKDAASSKSSTAKDREPASWRWDKQELERQVKDWKKKYEDIAQSSTDAKKDKEKAALKPAKFGSASAAVIKLSGVPCRVVLYCITLYRLRACEQTSSVFAYLYCALFH